MSIAVITYNAPHQKTQDLLVRLHARGHQDITVLATPWVARKNHIPFISHRPNYAIQVPLKEWCRHFGYTYKEVENSFLPQALAEGAYEHILIGGAGILPEEVALHFKVINSHPAWLPVVRGLDALKWAILEGLPVGVTTHFIDNKTDEGLLIDRKIVPLYQEDTFHTYAYRQYFMELDMLAEVPEILKFKTDFESLADERYLPHRRMSHELEKQMLVAFESQRKQAPSLYE